MTNAEEAERILNVFLNSETVSVLAQTAAFTAAEAHATLALAEQQRTANLIAYMAVQTSLLQSNPELVDTVGLQRVMDAAWEGLGL